MHLPNAQFISNDEKCNFSIAIGFSLYGMISETGTVNMLTWCTVNHTILGQTNVFIYHVAVFPQIPVTWDFYLLSTLFVSQASLW